jgi:hypothetical protein
LTRSGRPALPDHPPSPHRGLPRQNGEPTRVSGESVIVARPFDEAVSRTKASLVDNGFGTRDPTLAS